MGSTPRRLITLRLPEDLIVRVDWMAAHDELSRTGFIEAAMRRESDAFGEVGLEEAPASPVAASPPAAVGPAKSSASPRAPAQNIPGVVRGSEVKRGYRDPMAGRPLRSSFSDHDQWLLALQRWRAV